MTIGRVPQATLPCTLVARWVVAGRLGGGGDQMVSQRYRPPPATQVTKSPKAGEDSQHDGSADRQPPLPDLRG